MDRSPAVDVPIVPHTARLLSGGGHESGLRSGVTGRFMEAGIQ